MTDITQPTQLVFTQGRPFFEMVMSFLAATVGMGAVFDATNPLGLSPQMKAGYQGIVKTDVVIDMNQVHTQCISGALSPDTAVKSLCCMLLNSTYEIAKQFNDRSPEFEIFRHLRNAASHKNLFTFNANEPALPALWAGLKIDHTLKGSTNPLEGGECVGTVVSAGDIIALLYEIEAKLPN
ncbi:MAG: hypothetical protein ABL880_03940 [Methylotenera sp.]